MSEEVVNTPSEPVVSAEPVVSEPVVNTPVDSVPQATPEVTPEVEPKPVDKFASRFAELSRKDKAIMEKKKALEAQEKEIESTKAKLTAYEQAQAQLKQNPLAYLQSLGVSVDDVTRSIMEQGLPPQVDPVKQELDTYKAELEQLKAELNASKEEKINAERQKMYQDYRTTLETDMNEFPLAKLNHDPDFIIETINRHYQSTGEILQHKEVLAQYEQYYEEKLEAMKNIDKVKQKLGLGVNPQITPVVEPKVDVKPVEASKPAAKPAQTLSNKTATPAPMKSLDEMNDKERLAYAASILRAGKK